MRRRSPRRSGPAYTAHCFECGGRWEFRCDSWTASQVARLLDMHREQFHATPVRRPVPVRQRLEELWLVVGSYLRTWQRTKGTRA